MERVQKEKGGSMVTSKGQKHKGVILVELLVKENKFFMLMEKQGSKKEIRLYDEINPAIAEVKKSLRRNANSEDIELLSIEIKEEKFEIKTIPWSVIASMLVKEK